VRACRRARRRRVRDKLRDGLFKNRAGEQPAPPLAATSPRRAASSSWTAPSRPDAEVRGQPEVWVLLPSPAPRGDVIYKNDLGEPMLRATRLGGFTLFTDDRPNGEAVSLAGGGAPLRLPPMSPQAVFDRLAQASCAPAAPRPARCCSRPRRRRPRRR
jgi:hypothetical protein